MIDKPETAAQQRIPDISPAPSEEPPRSAEEEEDDEDEWVVKPNPGYKVFYNKGGSVSLAKYESADVQDAEEIVTFQTKKEVLAVAKALRELARNWVDA